MDRMTEYFWLIPLIPGTSSLLLLLFGPKLSRKWIAWQASGAVFLSLVLAKAAFLHLIRAGHGAPALTKTLLPWITSGSFASTMSFSFDELSAVMAVVVTGVGFLIHVYSVGYMAEDRCYAKYFAFLNLFTFFMLVLVMASDIVLMFVGWEGVGLCSYLLIGFWFDRPASAKAGMKAFIVNRIGDAAFIVGILFLLVNVGSASFAAINAAPGAGLLGPGLVTLVAGLLFVGATGKSAQIPLYVWLPDAMEGPTPVSALIHAATMVTAGVYMVARLSYLYAMSPTAMGWVAIVGVLTAIFAATIGFFQYDIKKVLAYSTVSQLGFMFVGVGVGAYWAGSYHLLTHAFFKATLFLASGSVILGCHHEQDMRRMGGLKKLMPITAWTYLVATWAIAGFPWASGFYSKDEILWKAFTQRSMEFFGTPAPWLGPAIFATGLLTALGTSFYMFRSYYMTFTGTYRGGAGHAQEHDEDPHSAHAAPHHVTAGHPHDVADPKPAHGHGVHAHPAPASAHVAHGHAPAHAAPADDHAAGHHGGAPHESPLSVTAVLVTLATGAVLVSILGVPKLWSGHDPILEHWLAPALPAEVTFAHFGHATEWLFQGMGVAAAAIGWYFAMLLFKDGKSRVPHDLKHRFFGFWTVVYNKYYVDEAYHALVIRPALFLAAFLSWFDEHIIDWIVNFTGWVTRFIAAIDDAIDKYVVDGAVNGVGGLTREGGRLLRRIETGRIQTYLYGAALGSLLVVLLNFLFR